LNYGMGPSHKSLPVNGFWKTVRQGKGRSHLPVNLRST
jgi:hypothetical protein